jgi:hypothetical protein
MLPAVLEKPSASLNDAISAASARPVLAMASRSVLPPLTYHPPPSAISALSSFPASFDLILPSRGIAPGGQNPVAPDRLSDCRQGSVRTENLAAVKDWEQKLLYMVGVHHGLWM